MTADCLAALLVFYAIHISLMLEKCFFNVIFYVEYYNMTENQYFSVYVYFHGQNQIIARDSRA